MLVQKSSLNRVLSWIVIFFFCIKRAISRISQAEVKPMNFTCSFAFVYFKSKISGHSKENLLFTCFMFIYHLWQTANCEDKNTPTDALVQFPFQIFLNPSCHWFYISRRHLEVKRNSNCNLIIACFWINDSAFQDDQLVIFATARCNFPKVPEYQITGRAAVVLPARIRHCNPSRSSSSRLPTK